MAIYVTLKPGVIWTPLPLIRLLHNYNLNELTLTFITSLVTTTISGGSDADEVEKAVLDGLPSLHAKGILNTAILGLHRGRIRER